MKVGIFSPYLETMGGGERYLLTVAEFFQSRGDQVDVFWNKKEDKAKLAETFNLDLSQVQFVPDVFFDHKTVLQKLLATAQYDLMFFLSDGSIPSSLASKNILHFQRPFRLPNQKTLLTKIKLSRFCAIVCNSQFTKKDIDKTYAVNSVVLYPPVDVKNFVPGKKENLILSVGRFFAPSNPKKQEVLVDVFKKMALKDYKFVLVGAVTGDSQDAVEKLRIKIKNLPIEIVTDASFQKLADLYSRAKIFWHAAGYGENLEKFPDRAEHFGITTVEAMAAGCVPIVFAAGGQTEIVSEGKTGLFWKTTSQLVTKTLKVVQDDKLCQQISRRATVRAKDFSQAKFFTRLNEII